MSSLASKELEDQIDTHSTVPAQAQTTQTAKGGQNVRIRHAELSTSVANRIRQGQISFDNVVPRRKSR